MSFGSGALPSPTREESARIERIKRLGCLACRQEGLGVVMGEAHHLTVGDKHGALRIGHHATVCLCCWHHRGVPHDGRTADYCRIAYGPSLALQPVAFRRRYGSGDALLLKQERVLRADVWGAGRS